MFHVSGFATAVALGGTPGLAHIGIAGQVGLAQFLKIDLHEFPKVARLVDRCFEIPAFADAHPFEQPGYRAAGG